MSIILRLTTGVVYLRSASGFAIDPSGYLNWDSTSLGTGGYGIRDNAGTIEWKNSGGSWVALGGGGGGSGTVTDVSIVSANGLAGTVATSTTTPAITLSTSITGILKGNGTAISAASAGTDYLAPTGAGTGLSGIPYTITGTANQVVASAGTGNITLSLPQSIATSSTPQFARLGLGAAANATIPLEVTAGNDIQALSALGGSITGSGTTKFSTLAGTWNTSGSPVAVSWAITETAKGANSRYFEILGGAAGVTDEFYVKTGGVGYFAGALTASNLSGSNTGDQSLSGLATAALDNLASVAINAALIPATAGALDFGSATKPWKDIYLAGASGTPGTNNFKITGTSTSGTRILTLADGNTTLVAGTMAATSNKLSVFAATSSAELAGVISDEQGSGALVFANTPTLITPVLGAATGTSLGLTGSIFIANAAQTVWDGGSNFVSIGGDSANIAIVKLVNKGTAAATTTQLSSLSFLGLNGGTTLVAEGTIECNLDGAIDATKLIFKTMNGSLLTAMTIDKNGVIGQSTWGGAIIGAVYGGTGVANNAAMTVTGSGNYAYTRTLSGTTNVTFPTTGTLATLAGTETLSAKTLTAPKLASGGFIADANGNEGIILVTTASAVNEVTVTNAATGTAGPIIAASGETNVDLQIGAKGTGKLHHKSGTYGDIQTYTPSAAGTATLDLSLSNVHHITMPAGNITIALSNGVAGQFFIIRILQDGTGSRTVTWFSTVRWSGGSAPTLTTTASKADTLGFEITGSSTYDGCVVMANV